MRSSKILVLALVGACALMAASPAPKRRVTAVTTAATTTQSINETAGDTARINAKRRAAAASSYVNENGYTVYVDTVEGTEWIDSTVMARVPKMEYPLWDAVSVGVNVWDPVMRVIGQKYGIADAWVELSLHNRYKPVFEFGLGQAAYTPAAQNFTYRSPLSTYYKIGANYNVLFNSDPAYSFFGGFRYGITPFSYSIDNVTLNSSYWDETSKFSIPSQRCVAGWLEFSLGLRVQLVGPLSAGWSVKVSKLIHQTKGQYGQPAYVPGYGAVDNMFSGSFSFIYTLPLGRRTVAPAEQDSIQ